MIIVERPDFTLTYERLLELIVNAPKVNVGMWQSQDISQYPQLITHELHDVHISFPMPRTHQDLIVDVKPNLPWAEDHMRERVSGKPLNPPPSEAWWPYAQQGNSGHKDGEVFSHTYPERFWPRLAGGRLQEGVIEYPHHGIRYDYGDLADLVDLLEKQPYTRQAYLPVWFPEDTGNVSGVRVPCTLGYHFMYRNNKFDCTYFIRSCDFVRHFRDDVFMAIRLAEWIGYGSGILKDLVDDGLNGDLGKLTMVIPSLHCFAGDMAKLKLEHQQNMNSFHDRLARAYL